MKLFYGSNTFFVKPTYGLGNPTNDYGLGFYMTNDKNAAKLWASQYRGGGYVMEFDLDVSSLNTLYLDNNDELSILKWITLLIKHRFSYAQCVLYKDIIDWLINHFDTLIENYDLVVGYRADDSYFNYSIGFVSGQISLQTLSEAMKIGKLGRQYVAISKKAFNRLIQINCEEISFSDDYLKFRENTLNEYHELIRTESINNTFIKDLVKKYGK